MFILIVKVPRAWRISFIHMAHLGAHDLYFYRPWLIPYRLVLEHLFLLYCWLCFRAFLTLSFVSLFLYFSSTSAFSIPHTIGTITNQNEDRKLLATRIHLLSSSRKMGFVQRECTYQERKINKQIKELRKITNFIYIEESRFRRYKIGNSTSSWRGASERRGERERRFNELFLCTEVLLLFFLDTPCDNQVKREGTQRERQENY